MATVIVVGVSIVYQFLANVDYNIVPIIVMSLIAGFIVFIKHKDNIVRLAKGEEKKISSRKN